MYSVFEIRPGVWHYCTVVSDEGGSGYEHFARRESEIDAPRFEDRAAAIAESIHRTTARTSRGADYLPERSTREFPSWDAGC